jgi:hypothetical protein
MTATKQTELLPCRNCGGQCDPTGWMCGDGSKGPECEGCGITTPDVESWNKLMAQSAPEPVQGEAVEVVGYGTWAKGLPPGTRLMRYDGAPLVRLEPNTEFNIPLMLVAQHNRIMAAASAKQDEVCPVCESQNVLHLMHCNDCQTDYAGAEQVNRNAAISRANKAAAKPDAELVALFPNWSDRISKVWIGHAHIDELVTIQREIDSKLAELQSCSPAE